MKKFAQIVCIAAFGLALSSCGGGQGRVIPRDRFAELYAELFTVDMWIDFTNFRTKADTTNVYLPIVEKFGYTDEDYRASVRHYLQDSEGYARILRKTATILDDRASVVRSFRDKVRWREDIERKAAKAMRKPVRFDTLMANAGFTDRVDIAMDEMGQYVFRKVLEDTSFLGPRLIITDMDSLAVNMEEKGYDERRIGIWADSLQKTRVVVGDKPLAAKRKDL